MEYFKLKKSNQQEVLYKAIDILRKGGIIAFPTETFYGLGVKYDNNEGLKRLYEIKKRSLQKGLPIILKDIEDVNKVAIEIPELAISLMKKYWPGPLTIVLKAKKELSKYITASTGKVAVRVPGESFALILVKEAGFPITATSANPSGIPPADNPQQILKYFAKDIDLIIDKGKTHGYKPSTIVEIVNDRIKILRNGILTIKDTFYSPNNR